MSHTTEAKSSIRKIWRFDFSLQAALEGEGTASTNDAEESKEPAQKKGKSKTTKAAAS